MNVHTSERSPSGPETRPGETEFLAAYNPREFPSPAVTVDICVFTIRDGLLQVLLVERADHPYKGFWAIPGGFVNAGNDQGSPGGSEDPDDAALRELGEETGLDPFPGHLEQLRTFGRPGRDPRTRVISIAYVAFAPDLPDPVAGSDATRARFWPVTDLDLDRAAGDETVGLAFDHREIITAALERVRSKIEYTTLAAEFLTEPFTLPDLRRVYTAVWGFDLDAANFSRKVRSIGGFVVEVPRDQTGAPDGTGGQWPGAAQRKPAVGRPAMLYTRGTAAELCPPLTRPKDTDEPETDPEP